MQLHEKCPQKSETSASGRELHALQKMGQGKLPEYIFLHVLSLGMIERCKHSPHDVAFQCKESWPRIRRYGSLNRTGPRSGRYSSLQIVLEENGATMEEHKVKMQV